MNVCFVCGEYPPAPHGGIGTMVQTLSRALVSAGHTVRVIGLYADPSLPPRDSDQGVEVWRLQHPRGPFRSIQSRRVLFRQVARWARAGEIDVIEVPDWQGWAAYWPSLPVPVVTRLNGSATYFNAEMGRTTPWLTRHLETGSLQRSDAWCSVSKYTADRTRAIFGLDDGPQAILPNPVTLASANEWTQRHKGMVIFSGTLTEKKGVIPLIDAWQRLASQVEEATLHLFGGDGTAPAGGSMLAHLKGRLSGRAAERTFFYGRVPHEQIATRLAQANVAIFPSYAEAFAIAPLEAMSAGCPTIGTTRGSGPELIDEGVNGLTADPERPEDIAAAIRRILSDDVLAQALAAGGRRTIKQHYSIDRLLPENVAMYRRCVAQHAAIAGRRHPHASTKLDTSDAGDR
jgi:glycosyltransferase involved in cell wall biosynthesis